MSALKATRKDLDNDIIPETPEVTHENVCIFYAKHREFPTASFWDIFAPERFTGSLRCVLYSGVDVRYVPETYEATTQISITDPRWNKLFDEES